MEIELKPGMRFLEVSTGTVWELTDTGDEIYMAEESLWFQAICAKADEDNVWRSTSTVIPKAVLDRRLRKGKWKQISNRKNNYY